MEKINFISLGNFKINNREFFRNILNATEENIGNINNIEDGEKYKYSTKEITYINNHLITDDLNIEVIKKNVKLLIENKKINNHCIMYFIDRFDEKIFNESIEIIKYFSQDKRISFLIIYIDNKKNDKNYLDELNRIMSVNILEVLGTPFKFRITTKKREQFCKWIIKFYCEEEKRKAIDDYSGFCIKKLYSVMKEIDDENLEAEEIRKIERGFYKSLEETFDEIIKKLNKNIKNMEAAFYMKESKFLRKESQNSMKNIRFDKSVLGKMAFEINTREEKKLRDKVLIKLGIKREEKENINKKVERNLINKAFMEKKKKEDIFKG